MASFNPFNESVAGRYFVGREDQIRQFNLDLNGLRAKNPRHMYIAGVHGTGKTSYLAKLVEIGAASGFVAVQTSLNESAIARDHVNTIMEAVVKGIEDRRKKDGSTAILSDWNKGNDSTLFQFPRSASLDNNKMRQDFETLSKYMDDWNIPGIVICIDEGQWIDPRALSGLKNALQFSNSFLTVLSLRLVRDVNNAVDEGRAVLDRKAQDAGADTGASRFYVVGLPIGAFDTEKEAEECIKKRLKDNDIQFSDEVVTRIGRITGRVPRDMVRLSSMVYDNAARDQIACVNLDLLNETFRTKYPEEIRGAASLYNEISEQARSALRGLLKAGRKADAAIVVTHLYPDAAEAMRSFMIPGIKNELERICAASSYCLKTEELFSIPKPIQAYALELALGMA